MKIKGQYVIRKIAGETVAVPVDSNNLDANILVMLNETGAILWNFLYKGAEESEIVSSFCDEYEIDEATVKKDLYEFVAYIKSKGILVE